MKLDSMNAATPPRSLLLGQVPIGLGTPSVESLESYTCRLARRHGVTRSTLEKIVIGRGPMLYLDQQGTPRLDAPTDAAAQFADRLAILTGCHEVRALGLGRFAGRLARAHSLRPQRAWCGKCFHDARANGQEAHLPLLWTLAGFERCVIHGVVLATQCPCCSRTCKPSRSWHRDLDHCPWCGKDLAVDSRGATQSFAQLARRGVEELDLFLGNVVAEFVARASMATEAVRLADLQGLVDMALAQGHVRNAAQLASAASVPLSTLVGMMKGRNSPSLQILARLAGAARVPMASIFLGDGVESDGPAPPPGLTRLPRLRYPRSHIWEEVQKDANEVVASGEQLSLTQLGQRLGVDCSHLSSRIDLEVRQIFVARGRAARAQTRHDRLTKMAEQIRGAIAQLSAEGLRVSARAVSARLNSSAGTPYFRLAYKMACAPG